MAEQTQSSVPQGEKRTVDVKKELFSWLKHLVVVFVAVFLIHTYVFMMVRVDGRSMMETLQDGDRIASTIIDLKLNGPQRGDIVILTYPGEDHFVIKRVIGMPGDVLSIVDGVTLINGEPYDEPYIEHPKAYDNHEPVTLGEDEFFVMGDNRANSHDSRKSSVGPVARDAIKAKARLRVWPLNSIGDMT